MSKKIEHKEGEYRPEKYPPEWTRMRAAIQRATHNLQMMREAGFSVPRPIGGPGGELYTILHDKEVQEDLELSRRGKK